MNGFGRTTVPAQVHYRMIDRWPSTPWNSVLGSLLSASLPAVLGTSREWVESLISDGGSRQGSRSTAGLRRGESPCSPPSCPSSLAGRDRNGACPGQVWRFCVLVLRRRLWSESFVGCFGVKTGPASSPHPASGVEGLLGVETSSFSCADEDEWSIVARDAESAAASGADRSAVP